jgi:hypothetical protein
MLYYGELQPRLELGALLVRPGFPTLAGVLAVP